MNKIPTAEDLLDKRVATRSKWICELMIEFAGLHVKAALKEASEKATLKRIKHLNIRVDKDSILNAYPLDKIK